MTASQAILPAQRSAMSRSNAGAMPAVAKEKSARNDALDFTKGSLVLIMVLYHWLNYFVTLEWDVYRYLRFLTPSFIFITGFIVSHVYLGQQTRPVRDVGPRLLKRGAKLLLLFIVLNVLIGFVPSARRAESSSFIDYVVSVYVTGNGKAAFDVLVPISYFLLLAPLVLLAKQHVKLALVLIALVSVTLASVTSLMYRGSVNLELLAIAFLGMLIGTAPLGTIERSVGKVLPLLVAYGAYVWAIATWNILFPLQVVGVCLSLLLIYLAGVKWGSDAWLPREIVELGKYSLFAYIFQVLALQVLRRGLAPLGLHGFQLLIPLVATTVLTVAAVKIIDRSRRRYDVVDRLYRVVFA